MSVRRATLKDVALASGVSPSTVSFVLNNTAGQTISPATRERVTRAAGELGYTPHRIARALREGRSRVVLLRLGEMPHEDTLAEFVAGLDDELSRRGYSLVAQLGAGAADPAQSEGAVTRELLATLAPVSVITLAEMYRDPASEADGGWSDGLAAHTLVQLGALVELGHRNLAFAVPEALGRLGLGGIRLAHARAAAARLGIPKPVPLMVSQSAEETLISLRELRRSHPEVTAVATFDDNTGFLVLAAARLGEVRVPEELSVLGFGSSRMGELWSPSLSTVRIDAEVYGRRAAVMAVGESASGDPAEGNLPEEWVPRPAEVLLRGSTGHAPA